MHTGLEDRARDYEKLAAYFAARARGGVGLMVTGGIAPNRAGWLAPFAGKLSRDGEIARHQILTTAVHAAGGRICMQILHAGRYAYHPLSVAPSALKAPISKFRPRALSVRGVQRQVADFVACAERAQRAGYDGVEVMGSEGYLINEFLSPRTNQRQDEYGGNRESRARFALEIVAGIRAATGPHFIVMFRLSGIDLVENGLTLADSCWLVPRLAAAGASLLNTGIGWHESRVPTIAGAVPRAAFAWVSRELKAVSSIPVVATNRINDPAVAEALLASGDADAVSMARPLLADPDWVAKARDGRALEINTCIACNQACLDKVFRQQRASCLVNPRAVYETELELTVVSSGAVKRVAVVGAGPAGLACAVSLAERGHRVSLFERDGEIGGQFRYAREVPGKEEFNETLRYFRVQIARRGIELKLHTAMDASALLAGKFDRVVVATGVRPRAPTLAGMDHTKVISYPDLLSGRKQAGPRVAIMGAGGIGFDVATFLTHAAIATGAGHSQPVVNELRIALYQQEWGVSTVRDAAGGLAPAIAPAHGREVWLLQRTPGRLGTSLGATTGWIHRRALAQRGVVMRSALGYLRIDDSGLWIQSQDGGVECLTVDSVVICAGQESVNELQQPLSVAGMPVAVIGGALLASELDAERAIREGTELAARL